VKTRKKFCFRIILRKTNEQKNRQHIWSLLVKLCRKGGGGRRLCFDVVSAKTMLSLRKHVVFCDSVENRKQPHKETMPSHTNSQNIILSTDRTHRLSTYQTQNQSLNKGGIEKNCSSAASAKKHLLVTATATDLQPKQRQTKKRQTTKWTIRNINLNQQLFIKTLREILRL